MLFEHVLIKVYYEQVYVLIKDKSPVEGHKVPWRDTKSRGGTN